MGVAISVTTVPAAAFFGVAVAIADGEHAVSALAVLGVNVTMMLAGGSAALAVQRALASRG